MKKSKIHSATITGLELYYEGSITIDKIILDKANILPNEQVQIVNLNNGKRLISYTIAGESNSGVIELNGPAARLGAIGDKIIIISYGNYNEDEVKNLKPKVILLNNDNCIISE
tara:strand:- start:131 stop:472 length:342 start_codon:yes stop_codon:yes gene_type:complete